MTFERVEIAASGATLVGERWYGARANAEPAAAQR
jgi:hypothetical protein